MITRVPLLSREQIEQLPKRAASASYGVPGARYGAMAALSLTLIPAR